MVVCPSDGGWGCQTAGCAGSGPLGGRPARVRRRAAARSPGGRVSGAPAPATRRLAEPGGTAQVVGRLQQGAILGHGAVTRGVNSRLVQQATGREGTRVSVVTRLFVRPGRAGPRRGATATRRRGGVRGQARLAAGARRLDGTQDAIAVYERAGWRLAGTGDAPWSTPDGATSTVRYYVKAIEPATEPSPVVAAGSALRPAGWPGHAAARMSTVERGRRGAAPSVTAPRRF